MEKALSEPKTLKKLLFHLVKKTKSEMEKQFLDAGISITPFQYAVLVLLEKEPSTMNDLARLLICRPPSLVPVIDSLEAEGYIDREADTQDRRKIQLIITKKGTEILEQDLFDDKDDALNAAFAKLDSAKRKQLLALLTELNDNFPL